MKINKIRRDVNNKKDIKIWYIEIKMLIILKIEFFVLMENYSISRSKQI